MTARIVTDSVSDITPSVVAEYSITVVPLNVVFNSVTYRDGVDITTDEFYKNLASNHQSPTTSSPAPQVFSQVYDKPAEETDETKALVEQLDAVFPKEKIYRSKVNPVIGTNVGPWVIGVAVLGDRK
jgi:fatty acid-binding protein DegV